MELSKGAGIGLDEQRRISRALGRFPYIKMATRYTRAAKRTSSTAVAANNTMLNTTCHQGTPMGRRTIMDTGDENGTNELTMATVLSGASMLMEANT